MKCDWRMPELPVRDLVRFLFPLFFVLTATANVVSEDRKPKEKKPPNDKLLAGKTLDDWITQAKEGHRLDDRNDALQALRNLGLSHDREKTLHAFTELLSDKAPTVRSLAAVGLRKGGRPTDPKAGARLVDIISQDLTVLKLPKTSGEVGAEFGSVMRAIAALEVIGDAEHVSALQRVAQNNKLEPMIRQVAANAIRQIVKRETEADGG